MNILFLDQTGKLAGAELVLLDVAKFYRETCLVCLFEDGPFREKLEQHKISVKVLLSEPIQVRRESSFVQSLISVKQLVPLIQQVVSLSDGYDLIYSNTLKALVVGALASLFSRRPLVFHLHDLLIAEHFSTANSRLIVMLTNRFAAQVVTVSHAARDAFIAAGGNAKLIKVIYNGFEPEQFQGCESGRTDLRQQLEVNDRFVVGHFSRLSPWKGQHILIEALTHCPETVTALLVGSALFGEYEYEQQLHAQVEALGLGDRVQFLGFRSDVSQLMSACDLVVHTSTSPEPFGRVIVEAMLCRKPVVAAAAGGAVELVDHGKTGWLVPPGNPVKLAELINQCRSQPETAATMAQQAQVVASQRFDINQMNQQIEKLLNRVMSQHRSEHQRTF